MIYEEYSEEESFHSLLQVEELLTTKSGWIAMRGRLTTDWEIPALRMIDYRIIYESILYTLNLEMSFHVTVKV